MQSYSAILPILKEKFDNEGFRIKYLYPISDAVEKFTEIDNIVFGKNDNYFFKEYKINDTRNQIFHYPKKGGLRFIKVFLGISSQR